MTSITSLCVYCGSSNHVSETHKQAARRFGLLMAEAGIRLVYGGGRVGLMGCLADGVLEAGGRVTGVIPDFLKRLEVEHVELDELILTRTMHERKQKMFDLADAFCVLPGGFGTMEELFEILTWKQLRQHDKPIVLVNLEGYWNHLLALMDHFVQTQYVRPDNLKLITSVNSIEEILPAIAVEPQPQVAADAHLM